MSTLTASYLRRIEARLIERRNELDARLHAAVLASIGDPAEATEVRDFKDAAADESDAALDEVELARAARERDDILAALRRIQEGTYGDCAECGRPIPVHRLEALLAAGLCADCQRRREAHATR